MNTVTITKCPTTMAHGTDGKWSVHSRLALEENRGRRFARQPELKLVTVKEPRVAASRFAGHDIICLVASNPRKPGTHGHRSFQIILDNGGELSYEDYRTKGGRPNDLQWDLERNYVKIQES